MTPLLVGKPLRLPNAVCLRNRLAKAPLSEGLADHRNRATERHATLYRLWAQGGAGLIITGNVQVDRRYLERPGNVVVDRDHPQPGAFEALRAFAQAGTADGAQLWMQLNHPGRQSPGYLCTKPVAPSAVPLDLSTNSYVPPRPMTAAEIEDVPARFAHAALVARDAGFTGVQVHAAHGYLLSQFLSPLTNRRGDSWGGTLKNRARLLLDTVRSIRRATAAGFCVSVRMNSSDFQQGGFSPEECAEVAQWLAECQVDLIELSGGSYERPAMLGRAVNPSSGVREAYFLEYARTIKDAMSVPIMLTGGFRSLSAMEQALADGTCDVIGLGRPMCVDADCPNKLLAGAQGRLPAFETQVSPSKVAANWFCVQLLRMGAGLAPDLALSGADAAREFGDSERASAARRRETDPEGIASTASKEKS